MLCCVGMKSAAPKTSLATLRRDLRAKATPARAKVNAWFFKTGKGQYGEGDKFLGVTVPDMRVVVRRHAGLALPDVEKLLGSPWHEERLIGALLLVRRWEKAREPAVRREIFEYYLAHPEGINNWDIVDASAAQIVGRQLLAGEGGRGSDKLLAKLARSKDMWQRRVAIVATFAFIRAGQFKPTFAMCDALLADEQDLLHKACGWMLREVGKRDKTALEMYLLPRYKTMPRTMLRYAIEKFPEPERKRYLKGVA